ncbi:TapY2 family type IVa secretion system protein [Shewanella sp. YIC-542]|uniref:TapY2 family type IVa secretion system protein n=1 Tax=Shewanella mytili TaxID=3377111 RepID=UPI00398F1ACE
MKKFLVMAILLSVGSAPVLAAKVSYKCHLLTTMGQEIGFYRWKEQDFKARQAALVASKRTDNKGKTYYVKEVKECVALSTQFHSPQAQKLDEQTLR